MRLAARQSNIPAKVSELTASLARPACPIPDSASTPDFSALHADHTHDMHRIAVSVFGEVDSVRDVVAEETMKAPPGAWKLHRNERIRYLRTGDDGMEWEMKLHTAATRGVLLLLVFPAGLAGQSIELSGQAVCSTCEIVVADRLALGALSDPAGPAGPSRVALGRSDNSFYVLSDQVPVMGVIVYSAEGRYAGALARRGQGPGEIMLAARVASAASGELYVYDLARSSIHVFGPDRDFRRTLHGIVQPIGDPLVLGDSIIAVLTGTARPRNASGQPVVLYDARSGALIRGMGPSSDLRPDQVPALNHIAQSEGATLWLVHAASGRIERWSLADQPVVSFRFADNWARFARASGAEPRATISRAWEDPQTGLLWITSVARDPGYRPPPGPPVLPGQPLPRGILDPQQVNARVNTIISVVDVRRRAVVAHFEIAEHVHQILPDGRLVVMQEADDGYQWIEVITLQLRGY
jgi:hypothetical protein